MEPGKDGDFVFTRSFYDKKPAEFRGKRNPETVANELRLRKREELAAMDVSGSPEYAKPLEACRANLRRIYGMEAVNKMPPIFLIPQGRLPYSSQGEFNPEHYASMIHVSRKMTLIELLSMHHEMEHSLGKTVKVYSREQKQRPQIAHQIGYSTATAAGEFRGRVLEEGLVQMNAIDFVANSKDPAVAKIRNEEFGVELFGTALTEGFSGVMKKILTGAKKHSIDVVNMYSKENYKEALNLIDLICKGAEAKDGLRGRNEIRKKLIEGRKDPKARFNLVKDIDSIFGSGTAKNIFEVEFTEQAVSTLNIYLQAVIWKRYPNFNPQP